jgi:hypothetical protein
MNRRLPFEIAEQLQRGGSHDAGGRGILVSDLICTTTEYTADTTWVQPANFITLFYEAQGAGGGGGSVDVAAGESAVGGGGGGGAYEAGWLLKREVAKSVAITIGAGGGAGTAGSDGVDGGDTSFGSHVTAPGGKKGIGSTADGTAGASGVGGAASGSQYNISGQVGVSPALTAGVTPVMSSEGGHSHLGWGGRAKLVYSGTSQAGRNGTGFGGGGSGGAAAAFATAADGGEGSNGKLILHVFTYAKA